MKATPAQVEKQRRLVAELRRRLAFETLVLERMDGFEERPKEPAPRTMAEVLERARRREANPVS